MVSPCSDRISRVPPYSRTLQAFTHTGLSPTMAEFPNSFRFVLQCHWPGPRSLATTCGVSVDVLSCRYLDVSVPCVRFLHPMYSGADTSQQCLETCLCLHSRAVPQVLQPAGAAWARPNVADALSRCMGSPIQRDQQNRFPKHLRWVSPFGYPWIKAYSQLPTAFRSVSRPSSPVHAKASTKCP